MQNKMGLPINLSPSFHSQCLKFLLQLKLCKRESGNSHFPLSTPSPSCSCSGIWAINYRRDLLGFPLTLRESFFRYFLAGNLHRRMPSAGTVIPVLH